MAQIEQTGIHAGSPRRMTVVANPTAGGGRFRRLESALMDVLRAAGWSVEVVLSTGRGRSEGTARHYATSAVICAAGGDGTVSEVVNGIMDSGSGCQLAVFPCGTGNDFARAIGLPEDPLEAAVAFASGQSRKVDCGVATWTTREGEQHRYFCNVVGIGMDAAAARTAVRFKKRLRTSAYTFAAIRTLAGWQPCGVTVTVPGAAVPLVEVTDGLFVSICNGPRSGGDFLIAPGASLVDGLLDYCAVTYPGFFRGLRLLPAVRHGRHVGEPEVQTGRADALLVEFQEPQDGHIDGELISDRVLALSARVLPRALSVLV